MGAVSPEPVMPEDLDTRSAKRKQIDSMVTLLFLGLIITFVLIGPWPTLRAPADQTPAAVTTQRRLERMPIEVVSKPGPIVLGYAQTDITPTIQEPLAGFEKRNPKTPKEVRHPLVAQALTLKQGNTIVTILSADLLLIYGDLTKDILELTGLSQEEIFFTASHTHAGLGGWHDGHIDQWVLGDYNPSIRGKLAQRLSDVILESRAQTVSDKTVYVTDRIETFHAYLPEYEQNRLDKDIKPWGKLVGMILHADKPHTDEVNPRFVWLSYNAHPTLVGHDERIADPDYPGYIRRKLQAVGDEYHVMFSAGAVGESRVKQHGESKDPFIRAERLAEALNVQISEAMFKYQFDEGQHKKNPPRIISKVLKVNLPLIQLNVPYADGWKFSPLLNDKLSDAETYIHVLKIGDLVMVGMPGDYGDGLATALDDWCHERDLELAITSFNGDYKGYLIDSKRYAKYPSYETRGMNFLGAYGGDYLTGMAMRLIDRIQHKESSLEVYHHKASQGSVGTSTDQ